MLALDERRAGVCSSPGAPPPRQSAEPAESRTRVLTLTVGTLEDLRRATRLPDTTPGGYCSDFQVCFPYRGLFVWHVGQDDVVGDPNQVVFVRGGEDYRMSSPSDQGYAELIFTPDPEVLSELGHGAGRSLFEHPLFTRRSFPASPRLQALRTALLHRASAGAPVDGLEADEAVLDLLQLAMQHDSDRRAPLTPAGSRLLRRTKAFLESRLTDRLTLSDISRAVGVSPAYLTNLFSRLEGVSLHQYLNQLRLSRALLDLAHAEDLTALALDLGFSSHSHFTFAFRRAFGVTPSKFRERSRRMSRPSPHLVRSAASATRIVG